jgi:hypothetical protein
MDTYPHLVQVHSDVIYTIHNRVFTPFTRHCRKPVNFIALQTTLELQVTEMSQGQKMENRIKKRYNENQ